jgi:competence protein ComEA
MKSLTIARMALVLGLSLSIQAHGAERIDINAADAEELDKVLVNVGPTKAKAIVEYRDANGPFRSAEELAEVKGIGLNTIERNRDLIDVGAGDAPRPKAPRKATGRTVKRQ